MSRSKITRAAGLISSATGDTVEAAVIDTDGRDDIRPLGGVSLPYDERLRWRILEATQNDLPTTEVLRLERDLTEHYAEAYRALAAAYPDETSSVAMIGFYGPTLRHIPSEGLTLQIGNPWQLAEATQLPVVSDFRRHDMATGGQGGPLAAMFHWAHMAQEPRPALMLNVSSVCSVTWLSTNNEIIAGDTGPGIGLLNEWVQEMADRPHDLDGAISSQGKIDEQIVDATLDAPFFSRPLPKAAGRHEFDHVDVSGLSVEDGAATLCAITARAVAAAAKLLPDPPNLLWVTGAGSEQPVIIELLKSHFAQVRNVAQRGLDPRTMAAECFAWMAVRHARGLPITTPETTGCRSADCAGFMARPR